VTCDTAVAMQLSHFEAMLLLAAVLSFVFAFLNKAEARQRMRYALLSFLAFVLIAVAAGWLMYFFSR
jgi:hypothetical protein